MQPPSMVPSPPRPVSDDTLEDLNEDTSGPAYPNAFDDPDYVPPNATEEEQKGVNGKKREFCRDML